MFADPEFWLIWAMFTVAFKLWVDAKLVEVA